MPKTSTRPVLWTATMLLASAPVSAQPPPQGWVGQLPAPSILCDTPAQLRSIVQAFAESDEAGILRYAELYGTINARGEPTCAVTVVPAAEAGDAEDVGTVSIAGTPVSAWILPVSNQAGSGVYLFLETPRELLNGSI